MSFIKTFTVVCISLFLIQPILNAQETGKAPQSINIKERGFPFIQNYSPDTYNAFDQNWGFAQDTLGILYVANGDGVLSFDGVNWDLVELPNKGTVFSLGIDPTGVIYVGAHNELGYLQADSLGQLAYISLLPFLEETHRDFNIIWNIITTPDGVFFRSKKKIFRWDGKKFKIWTNDGGSGQTLYYANNSIFLFRNGHGLFRLKEDKFLIVPESKMFAQNNINFIIPFVDERQFLISSKDKLYIYDGATFEELVTNRPDFFKENRIYCGIRLNDGAFALGSLNKGILVIDKKGYQQEDISHEGLLSSKLSIVSDSIGNTEARTAGGKENDPEWRAVEIRLQHRERGSTRLQLIIEELLDFFKYHPKAVRKVMLADQAKVAICILNKLKDPMVDDRIAVFRSNDSKQRKLYPIDFRSARAKLFFRYKSDQSITRKLKIALDIHTTIKNTDRSLKQKANDGEATDHKVKSLLAWIKEQKKNGKSIYNCYN